MVVFGFTCFGMKSHSVAQTGLEVKNFFLPSLKCSDSRHMLLWSMRKYVLFYINLFCMCAQCLCVSMP